MTRHMTEDASALAEQAADHAIRLGHPYLGGEHLPGRHTAEAVRDALIAVMSSLPPELRRSLPWDQGKELALHKEVSAVLGMPFTSATRPAPGSGRATRTPTACCASTSLRAATCACTGRTTWTRSPPS